MRIRNFDFVPFCGFGADGLAVAVAAVEVEVEVRTPLQWPGDKVTMQVGKAIDVLP